MATLQLPPLPANNPEDPTLQARAALISIFAHFVGVPIRFDTVTVSAVIPEVQPMAISQFPMGSNEIAITKSVSVQLPTNKWDATPTIPPFGVDYAATQCTIKGVFSYAPLVTEKPKATTIAYSANAINDDQQPDQDFIGAEKAHRFKQMLQVVSNLTGNALISTTEILSDLRSLPASLPMPTEAFVLHPVLDGYGSDFRLVLDALSLLPGVIKDVISSIMNILHTGCEYFVHPFVAAVTLIRMIFSIIREEFDYWVQLAIVIGSSLDFGELRKVMSSFKKMLIDEVKVAYKSELWSKMKKEMDAEIEKKFKKKLKTNVKMKAKQQKLKTEMKAKQRKIKREMEAKIASKIEKKLNKEFSEKLLQGLPVLIAQMIKNIEPEMQQSVSATVYAKLFGALSLFFAQEIKEQANEYRSGIVTELAELIDDTVDQQFEKHTNDTRQHFNQLSSEVLCEKRGLKLERAKAIEDVKKLVFNLINGHATDIKNNFENNFHALEQIVMGHDCTIRWVHDNASQTTRKAQVDASLAKIMVSQVIHQMGRDPERFLGDALKVLTAEEAANWNAQESTESGENDNEN